MTLNALVSPGTPMLAPSTVSQQQPTVSAQGNSHRGLALVSAVLLAVSNILPQCQAFQPRINGRSVTPLRAPTDGGSRVHMGGVRDGASRGALLEGALQDWDDLGSLSAETSGLFAEDWAQLAADPHFQAVSQLWEGSAVLMPHGLLKALLGSDSEMKLAVQTRQDDALNIASVETPDTNLLPFNQAETEVLQKAVGLTQFASGRVSMPLAVLFIKPDASVPGIRKTLAEHFDEGALDAVMTRLPCDSLGQPSVVAVDLSAVLFDLVDTSLSTLASDPLLRWVTVNEKKTTSTADAVMQADTPSVVNAMIEALVLQSLADSVPPGLVSSLRGDDVLALKVLNFRVAQMQASKDLAEGLAPEEAASTEGEALPEARSDRQRVAGLARLIGDPEVVRFLRAKEPLLLLPKGSTVPEIVGKLKALFPAHDERVIESVVRPQVPCNANGGSLLALKLPAASFVRAEAKRLFGALRQDQTLMAHARRYDSLKRALQQVGDPSSSPSVQKMLAALQQRNMTVCGALIQALISSASERYSPVLLENDQFASLLMAWFDLPYQDAQANGSVISAKENALLETFFPVSAETGY